MESGLGLLNSWDDGVVRVGGVRAVVFFSGWS